MAHRITTILDAGQAQRAVKALTDAGAPATLVGRVAAVIETGGEVVCLGSRQHGLLLSAVATSAG